MCIRDSHKQLYAVRFALLDLDDLVEVGFRVAFSGFDLALHHLVIRRIDIVIERGGNLLYAERREEAVIDSLLERVGVNRLAEIEVGVGILFALRRCSQPELDRGSEVIHDAAPVAFIVRPAAMALVNDDEIEEIRGILAEIWRS